VINLIVRNVAATCACRKHTFVVVTDQTSRAPRKCGQPISISFSAELARIKCITNISQFNKCLLPLRHINFDIINKSHQSIYVY